MPDDTALSSWQQEDHKFKVMPISIVQPGTPESKRKKQNF